MISTSNLENNNFKMTPEERKQKVSELRKEHQDYFEHSQIPDALFIPKMAYRPQGKDELHISFFESELEKGQDIYTEFVSIDYDSEDPKRTLYLYRHNPFWKEEYEIVTSKSGFERYIIPVSELKQINDVTNRQAAQTESILDLEELPNPEDNLSMRGVVMMLERIAVALEKISNK